MTLDGYLGTAMKKINNMASCDRDRLSERFGKAMQAAFDIFGDNAFRKIYDWGERRRPVSKALFEAWGVGLARRSDEEIRTLVKNWRGVINEFISLMYKDQEFDEAISYSTGTPARVKKRFRGDRRTA